MSRILNDEEFNISRSLLIESLHKVNKNKWRDIVIGIETNGTKFEYLYFLDKHNHQKIGRIEFTNSFLPEEQIITIFDNINISNKLKETMKSIINDLNKIDLYSTFLKYIN